MTRPRILFLDQSGVLGGAELYLCDVAYPYRRDCRILVFEEGPFLERLHAHGIDSSALSISHNLLHVGRDSGPLREVSSLFGMGSAVRAVIRESRDFDVVYANSQKSFVIAALASLWSRKPVVWNLHDMLTSDHFSSWHRRIVRVLANKFAARVIVNSEATREAFVASGGTRSKTRLVYNGIDARLFEDVTSETVCELRRSLGLEGRFVIGCFSRLAAWKGQHVLIRALSTLPGVHAVLVGDAIFHSDHEYASSLREEAARLGVSDRVHFLGFRHDVGALAKLVDVVVHTSVAPEPFGRVIVEGMLARTPVVATRLGGACEIVEEGVTGWLVPPDDAESLAGRIAAIQSGGRDVEMVIDRAYEDSRKRFSVEEMRSRIDVVLSDL